MANKDSVHINMVLRSEESLVPLYSLAHTLLLYVGANLRKTSETAKYPAIKISLRVVSYAVRAKMRLRGGINLSSVIWIHVI